MASLIKSKRCTRERVEKFISPVYFTDVNLYGRLYPSNLKAPFSSMSHFAAPGRVPFKEAMELGNFVPTKPGSSFGPTWSTHWFKVKIDIPETFLGKEVHLRWNSGCEAMVWSDDGLPLQGLSGNERSYFVITYSADLEDLRQAYYIEMACNMIFGAGSPTMISPPDPNKYFTLDVADIAVFDRQVYLMLLDLEVLLEISDHLSSDNPRSYEALYAANKMVNILQVTGSTKEGYEDAKKIGESFFSKHTGDSQHLIIAVGHCHIDCAWLWPYEETVRKCARSWSSVVRLMEQYPEFHFACSQAQQFMWVKENYPTLYDKVKYFVAKGQFLPVGGTWVEMDGNLPSGESFIRHFLYGQRFFEQEFCKRCKEFWLPDTFGYSAQLPQIMRLCEISRFLSTKLSWNLYNHFPHDNFIWKGIDGSTVLVHFPPAKTYEAKVSVEEVLNTVKKLNDKGRVSCSMMLYGYGDGGGGPTESMLERIHRLQDVDEIPRMKHGTPDDIFSHLENSTEKLCQWVGELYLELHNGTYTTQAKIKQMNRECEFYLHDAELLHSILLAVCKEEDRKSYPKLELERLWKILLLNQFHDVLPGSSISEVNKDAVFYFQEVEKGAKSLIFSAASRLFGVAISGKEEENELVLINTLSWQRTELIQVPWRPDDISHRMWIEGVGKTMQSLSIESRGGTLVPVVVGPMGYQLLRGISAVKNPVFVEQRKDGCFVLNNQYLEAVINHEGCISSLLLFECQKNAISINSLGNNFVIFDDIPLYWDAWDVMDYHLETRRSAVKEILQPVKITEQGPLRVTLSFSLKIGENSTLYQNIILDAVHPYLYFETNLDWHENHKFLKVEFPVNVLSQEAAYEIQYGYIRRPTHFNTSWDWAKYEVCAHKWTDLSEHDWGVAVLNTNKYGYAVHENVIRLSLMRSPKNPDGTADMGEHSFTYALMPHSGTFQDARVIQHAYQLNCPLRLYNTSNATKSEPLRGSSTVYRVLQLEMHESLSWFQVNVPGVIIDAVKKAEDRDDCLILRLYEAFGSRVRVTLQSCLTFSKAVYCNGLEDIIEIAGQKLKWKDGCVELAFTPFQVICLLLYLEI